MVWNCAPLRARQALPRIRLGSVVAQPQGAQRMVQQRQEWTRPSPPEQTHRLFALRPVSTNVLFPRNLFPRGLTLLDLKGYRRQTAQYSNVAAVRNWRDLMKALNLPGVDVNF